jgi:parvulin-like peptidyl-prolyl cis-trans isomerase-like protein
MRKRWLLCVLFGTMAWGQEAPGAAPMPPMQNQAAKAETPAAEVPENAAVLTITGVCPATTTASKATAGKTAGAKTASAKNPAECKTVITRKEFEKIASGLSPNVTPQLKRQLATALPKFMAMSEAAEKKGLENTDAYKETLKIAKMQILTTQLQRQVQEEADKISDADVEAYYKKNPEAFEQFSLDRLFIPRNKQIEPEKTESDEKLTEGQQKAKADAEKAKQEQGQKDMDQLAEALQKRAAAGEDIAKLQKEAYEAAGMKMDNPTVNLPSVRRTGLPPAQQSVFDLKAGEVSPVISDAGGHYVYKVVSKTEIPLDDKLKTEIHNTLKSQRLREMMDAYQNSYKVDQNEAYFGPATMPGRPGPPHMGMHPPQGPPGPSSGNAPSPAPSPAPAQQAPPTSQNK